MPSRNVLRFFCARFPPRKIAGIPLSAAPIRGRKRKILPLAEWEKSSSANRSANRNEKDGNEQSEFYPINTESRTTARQPWRAKTKAGKKELHKMNHIKLRKSLSGKSDAQGRCAARLFFMCSPKISRYMHTLYL
jgi:hypothetical protein